MLVDTNVSEENIYCLHIQGVTIQNISLDIQDHTFTKNIHNLLLRKQTCNILQSLFCTLLPSDEINVITSTETIKVLLLEVHIKSLITELLISM